MVAEAAVALVCLFVLVMGPGALIAWCGGARGWLLVSAALPLGFGVIGLGELATARLGLLWGPDGLGVCLLVTACACAVVAALRRLASGGLSEGEPAGRAAQAGPRDVPAWALPAAVAVSAVLLGLGMGLGTWHTSWGLGTPAQAFDAVFHLSAVQEIRQHGNASSLVGVAGMYPGQDWDAAYYPTVWHGIVAMVPGSVPLASNMMVVMVGAVWWPLGVAGLAAAVVGPRSWGAVVATVLAGASSTVTVLLTTLSVWPYAMSVVALPSVLVLGLAMAGMGRTDAGCPTRVERSRCLGAGMLFFLACGGAALAHGTAVFNIAVIFLVPAVVWVARTVRGQARSVRLWVLLAVVVAVPVVGLGAWRMRQTLSWVLSYQRPAANPFETLFLTLTGLPLYGPIGWDVVPAGLAATGLCVAAWWLGRRGPQRGRVLVLVAMALLGTVFVTVVGGPQWPLRQLGSPWYVQRSRVIPLAVIPALALAALGAELLVQRWRARRGGLPAEGTTPQLASARGGRRWWRSGGALVALAVLLAGAKVPMTASLMQQVHDPDRIMYGTLTRPDELEFYQRIAGELPPGALVLGAPSRGVPYLFSTAGVRVVLPSRTIPSDGPAYTAAMNWPTLEPGSRVCNALQSMGVQYYLRVDRDDDLLPWGSADLRWDTSLAQWPQDGLELVDRADTQGGSISLWRIVGCTPTGDGASVQANGGAQGEPSGQ